MRGWWVLLVAACLGGLGGPVAVLAMTAGPLEPATPAAAQAPAGAAAEPAPALQPSAVPEQPLPAGEATVRIDPPAAGEPPVRLEPPLAPVVERGTGQLTTVAGGSPPSSAAPLRRYRVEVEEGLGIEPGSFASSVASTLADPRSWGAGGRLSFQRVDDGPVDFRVVLASPRTTDRLCSPLDTAGIYSCGTGTAAVINSMRWLRGAPAYDGQLEGYRQYVVNHEVGHVLGHRHAGCPGAGRLAPVMMQQTKGVGACAPSPWPFP